MKYRSLSEDAVDAGAGASPVDYNKGFNDGGSDPPPPELRSQLSGRRLSPIKSPHSHYLLHSPHAGKKRAISLDRTEVQLEVSSSGHNYKLDSYSAAVNARMSQVCVSGE